MADTERVYINPWLLAFCGLATGGALGGLIFWLLRRDRSQLGDATAPVNVWNIMPGAQLPAQLAAPQVQPVQIEPVVSSDLRSSDMQTYRLSTTKPSRVVTAGKLRHTRAQLRNLGPPGSIAYVAGDPNTLAYPNQCLAIPAGGWNEVHVRPTDALFAIGSINGVQLSIAASEEVT